MADSLPTDRRSFLAKSAIYLWSAAASLEAEHHLISAAPLITEVELDSGTGRYVPLSDFYIRNHKEMPMPAPLSISIEGEVEHPRQLTDASLASLERIEQGGVLECAGSLVGPICQACNGRWGGWWLRDVLPLAGPTSSAQYLNFYGRDEYCRSVPIGQAIEDGILATHLNGTALPRQHGGVRIVLLGRYGMDSVKWLDRIVAARQPLAAADPYLYTEARKNGRGEVEIQPLPCMQPKSVILTPTQDSVLREGITEVKGLAWSGGQKVVRVEISGDGGANWRVAELFQQSRFEWVSWRGTLIFQGKGPAEVVSRATNERGVTQPARRDPDRLDLYVNNWYHRIHCVVV